MKFKKAKRIRLHGKALYQLNRAIHERDNNSCIICGHWVDAGVKFHHYPFGSGNKSDEIEKGVTLCLDCHGKAHGAGGAAINERCAAYLARLYPLQNSCKAL